MAREIGVSNITFFPLLTDNSGSQPTYGEAIKIPWAVNFETEDEYSEGSYYADNITENSIKKLAKVNVTMEVSSDTPPALDAKLTGKYHDKARSVSSTRQKAPRGAIAYEILMDDDTVRRRVIYNVTLTRNSQSNSTVEDSMDGKTYTYEGVGIPLQSNSDVDLVMDQKEVEEYVADTVTNEDYSEVQAEWEGFFNEVVLRK